jgi:arabinose-5-phosphate isomerase
MSFDAYVRSIGSSLTALKDPELSAQILSTAQVIAGLRRCFATGVGKSARAASLFAEDLATLTLPSGFIHGGDLLHGGMGTMCPSDCIVFFSDGGRTAELAAASRLARVGTRILVTSADRPEIEAEHVVRYQVTGETPYGLPSATVLQMIIGRYLAICAAEAAKIPHHNIRWAHPA